MKLISILFFCCLNIVTQSDDNNVIGSSGPENSSSQPRKGYFNSLTNGLSQGAKGALGKFGRRGEKKGTEEGDVVLKGYKGADEEQDEEEQAETDAFFSQFKNSHGRVCFQLIGCFSASEYNDNVNRPTPVLPQSPDIIRPTFHIFTLEARSLPRNFSFIASMSQLKYSTFNQKLRTAFIIHGFQSGFSLWMENLKDFIQYQSGDGYNVVLVNWENGARHVSYNQAAANTRVVGACIGHFINTLCKTFNIKNDMFYLIGHDLGAHAAGYAGKRLHSPKVGRITALDAAGIGFHFPKPMMRLDSGDASIVDVIHTDIATSFTDGFGTKDTLGHYEFFPNGGCSASDGVLHILSTEKLNGEEITCSHFRAVILPIDLNKPEDDCSVVAYQCPTYEMFLEGRCASCKDNRCQLMGINPLYWLDKQGDNKTRDKQYFINTAGREEFCLYHYQFGVHITIDSDSTTGILQFNLKLTHSGDKNEEILMKRIMTKTNQKKIHTFLVTFDFKVDKVYGLDLQWFRYNASERYRVNRGYKLKIPFIEVNFMSHMDERVRKNHSSILCSDNQKIIANKQIKEFKECNPSLKQKASDTEPERLTALEWKEDIYSVDFRRNHRVFHKIPRTRIREKIRSYQIVD